MPRAASSGSKEGAGTEEQPRPRHHSNSNAREGRHSLKHKVMGKGWGRNPRMLQALLPTLRSRLASSPLHYMGSLCLTSLLCCHSG